VRLGQRLAEGAGGEALLLAGGGDAGGLVRVPHGDQHIVAVQSVAAGGGGAVEVLGLLHVVVGADIGAVGQDGLQAGHVAQAVVGVGGDAVGGIGGDADGVSLDRAGGAAQGVVLGAGDDALRVRHVLRAAGGVVGVAGTQ